jgi:hypothetical protein
MVVVPLGLDKNDLTVTTMVAMADVEPNETYEIPDR